MEMIGKWELQIGLRQVYQQDGQKKEEEAVFKCTLYEG